MPEYNPLVQLNSMPQPWPVLARGSDSWWVKLLRRVLAYKYAERGTDPWYIWADPAVPVSGFFDLELEAVVRECQKLELIEQDGKVGQFTWGRFSDNTIVAVTQPGILSEAALRFQVVSFGELLERLHVRERGSNRGEVVDAFQRHALGTVGFAWCIAFCDFTVDNAFRALGAEPPFNIAASSSALVATAKRLGRLKAASKVMHGDLFVVRGGPTGYKHGGIVRLRRTDGTLLTVEGNTNSQGGAEGNGLFLRARNPKHEELEFIDVCRP